MAAHALAHRALLLLGALVAQAAAQTVAPPAVPDPPMMPGMATTTTEGATSTQAPEEGGSATANLANTLFITFFAVFLGYTCVRTETVVPARGDMRGLGFFVGQVAFPLLVFKTVATAEFGAVDLYVTLACTLGKLVVFVITWGAAYFAYKTDRSVSQRWLTASILSFFVVASNDFAIGFPVIQALYAGQHMFIYIAANALVSNAMLTPIVMVLLAVGANLAPQEAEHTESGNEKPPRSSFSIVLSVVREILLNPVIMMAILGFAFKYILGSFALHHDEAGNVKFFSPMQELISLLTAPFTMMALFLTGASLQTPKIQFWPILLVLMKVVICAYATYAFAVYFVGPVPSDPTAEGRLQNFSFLYGMIPTSSAPLLFARQFDPEATGLVATAILFGLVVAGPLMFGAAVLLEGVDHVLKLITAVALDSAGASLVCGTLIIVMLLILRQEWGWSDPFKFLIAAFALVMFFHEGITMLMNPNFSESACTVFLADPRWSFYGIVLSALQHTARNLVLMLVFMALTNRFVPQEPQEPQEPKEPQVPQEPSVKPGFMLFIVILLVSFILGFFTVPHTIKDMCNMGLSKNEMPEEESIVLNVITDVVFLLLFGGVALMWAIKGSANHGNVDATTGESSASAEEGADEYEEDAEDPFGEGRVKPWLSKPPKSILQGLAVTQVVLVIVQFVNTSLSLAGRDLQGSFAMMMLVETMLQHSQLAILFALLVSNLSFTRHFMEIAAVVMPWFFWGRGAEEDEDIFEVTGLATAHFADLPMMHRLSSTAGGFMHPEDIRRRATVVGRQSTSVGGRQSHVAARQTARGAGAGRLATSSHRSE